MKQETKRRAELRRMTVRISAEAYDIIKTLADEHHKNMSDIVRMAIDMSLEKYLGRIRYIEPEQAKIINKNIISLGNVLMEVRDQMRRIGINYNQEMRIRNAKQKQKALEEKEQAAIKNKLSTITLKKIIDEKTALDEEIQNITKDSKLLDKKELDDLIRRVEDAVQKAGDEFCMYL